MRDRKLSRSLSSRFILPRRERPLLAEMSKPLSYLKAVILCLLHLELKIVSHFVLKSCYILRCYIFRQLLHFAAHVEISEEPIGARLSFNRKPIIGCERTAPPPPPPQKKKEKKLTD